MDIDCVNINLHQVYQMHCYRIVGEYLWPLSLPTYCGMFCVCVEFLFTNVHFCKMCTVVNKPHSAIYLCSKSCDPIEYFEADCIRANSKLY